MVEMLGVLAIMGIVGMVGVRMYTSAMNKHRANELIYEAQKRATMVAMQITAGQENLSITNFTNPTGYTFGVEKNPNNANQFNITMTGVDSKVCEHMKTAVGPATPIRVISNTCDMLTFNNDLSTTAYASDYSLDKDACTSNGFKSCANGDNGAGRKCIQSGADCCVGIEYNEQCETCNSLNGVLSNITLEGNSCTHTRQDNTMTTGICKSGTCVDADVTEGATCTSNADCGGTGSGYYCLITYSADANLNSSLDGTLNTTETVCYRNLKGTCAVVSGQTRQTASKWSTLIKAGFPSTLIQGPKLNWWSANNWCLAQGKHLLDISEIECYRQGHSLINSGGTWAYCCKKGQTCGQSNWVWSGTTIADAEKVAKFSDKIVALRKAYSPSYFWTASSYANNSSNSCYAFLISTGGGYADHAGYRYRTEAVLCK